MTIRSEVLMLGPGVTVADLANALGKSGLTVSNGPFPNLFVINKTQPKRFYADNVIDLTVPLLCRRQAGPIHDIAGVDYGIDSPNDAA